jgi:hypothetical protein
VHAAEVDGQLGRSYDWYITYISIGRNVYKAHDKLYLISVPEWAILNGSPDHLTGIGVIKFTNLNDVFPAKSAAVFEILYFIV